jgi:hypothetical protein
MRGALIVKRRRSSRKRIFFWSPQQLDNTAGKKAATSELVRLCFCGNSSVVCD